MGTALITGAGGGVGRAIALRFAADGYAVAAIGRTGASLHAVAEAIAGSGGQALPISCDVTSRAEVRHAVEEAQARLGPVAVLVNSAAIAESAPFTAMDDELWDRTLAVNLTGTFNCMRAVIGGMFERRRGRIINIASVAARLGFPYTAAYVASKHGVLGLTRAVAVEAAPRGVTVNTISPGWLDTAMTERSVERIAERTGRSREEARRRIEAMNARQRLIDPTEVADAAAYLASPAAAAVNGQDIEIQ
jgi:NAD(P)-dependent dehydrogenase (short-subunit alcohol dehydrogenase family)